DARMARSAVAAVAGERDAVEVHRAAAMAIDRVVLDHLVAGVDAVDHPPQVDRFGLAGGRGPLRRVVGDRVVADDAALRHETLAAVTAKTVVADVALRDVDDCP